MPAEDPYSILFENVQIGPVTARNRFYQVPHCCGFGHLKPQGQAAMRGMKAEGGWAVVSTEEAEIHPSSDLSPYTEQRIWDERDIPALQLITDIVHKHGALAAIELAHNGHRAPNLFSRIPPIAPSSITIANPYPKQARAMDKSDIRNVRQWHRQAIRNAKAAGFDIVYVYAGHHMTLPHHFTNPIYNQRTDEYGGSLQNRIRLTRELLEDAQDEAAGECAIAFRFSVDDMVGKDGMQAEEEGRAIVEMLAELPDLWDLIVSGWENDSVTSRFEPNEGYQESYMAFVKQLTSKPVVGVGRYTSADKMASLVRKGVLDFIGAARPSIADPFLPNKIRDNRIEDICECIGCNICISSDTTGVPIRCTQNPTMGEEWRRQWHPEKIALAVSNEPVLVVGAGPAGLECALQLSNRGYKVTLAEADNVLGGRALRESTLPGLSAWKRVSDYRIGQLEQRADVDIYCNSELDADAISELDIPHIFIATGASWRRDGLGRSLRQPISIESGMKVLTPDDILDGEIASNGPVVIYDDDQGYMAGVIAEKIAQTHNDITFISSKGVVSAWTSFTLEQERIQSRLIALGIKIVTNRMVSEYGPFGVKSNCVYGGEPLIFPCNTLVLVTEKQPENDFLDKLRVRMDKPDNKITTLEHLGDVYAPGLIVDAVFSGHLAARNFQRDPKDIQREFFMREMPQLSGT